MSKTHFLKVRATFDRDMTPEDAARAVRKLMKGKTFLAFNGGKLGAFFGRITYVSPMPSEEAKPTVPPTVHRKRSAPKGPTPKGGGTGRKCCLSDETKIAQALLRGQQ